MNYNVLDRLKNVSEADKSSVSGKSVSSAGLRPSSISFKLSRPTNVKLLIPSTMESIIDENFFEVLKDQASDYLTFKYIDKLIAFQEKQLKSTKDNFERNSIQGIISQLQIYQIELNEKFDLCDQEGLVQYSEFLKKVLMTNQLYLQQL